jgi:sec-independent protein translocase protein TatC
MAKSPDKDLFAESTMSFGDHLEELRACLMKSVIGLIIGCLFGLLVANRVVLFIQGPLTAALKDYYLELEKDEIKAEYGEDAAERLTLIDSGLEVDTMQIDMDALWLNLHQQYSAPGAFLGYQPFSFVFDDFLPGGVPLLFNQIVKSQPGTTSAAAELKSRLSEDELQLAEKLSSIGEQELADDLEVRMQAVRLLNGWIAESDLAGTKAFRAVKSESVAIRRLRERQAEGQLPALAGPDQRRLNQLLVKQVFRDVLRPPQPQLLRVPLWKPIEIRVQTLNAQEAFMIWLKAAFIAGFLLASPWVFYQIWSFVAAGLYPHEKKYVSIYLPFSMLLFLGGAGMAFFFVFEPVLDFLFSFNRAMEIHPDPRISEWMGFVLFLPLGFGIAFQLPLVMLLLHRIGIISVASYLSKWRIAILIIFVLSMLLTPADPISMLLMAVPLTLLYFLGILMCVWMPSVRNPYKEGYDPS